MSSRNVEALYDALHAFESPYKRRDTYPVHKKLRFDDAGTTDIYDWIAARVDSGEVRSILDAGCGVGFGTLRLAESSGARVMGISLSAAEVMQAQDAAKRRGLEDRAAFRCGSFDELAPAAYDLVVAVESLKHSPDLAATLRSLVRSVAPTGQLVIVDDLLTGDSDSRDAQCLKDDWWLTDLHSESDYLVALGGANCRVVDLSSGVRASRRLSRAAKLAALRLAMPFAAPAQATALRAFRGGLRLEALYAAGAMTYKAIFYRHPTER